MSLIYKVYFLDPAALVNRLRGIVPFRVDLREWERKNRNPTFRFSWKNAVPLLEDRFKEASAARGYYFFQDIWAAQKLHERNITFHVDVGSSVSGFVAHVLSFGCTVVYIDVRPLPPLVSGLWGVRANITALPLTPGSIRSLSCLHVLEHVGLGRYGDPVDPDGHVHAASSLQDVLARGGVLLIGTPIGRERLCFNAHRIFSPHTVIRLFNRLRLREFSYIPESEDRIIRNACLDDVTALDKGCGLFDFIKE